MKVYVVENVRPNMQVFGSYDNAFQFAKVKADKRRGPTAVWFEAEGEYQNVVYQSSQYYMGDSHIVIYERTVAEG